MPFRSVAAVVIAATAAVVLVGCSTSSPRSADSGEPSGNGPVSVVASTNVYGSIAKSIGGSHVQVTSILDNPDQDPHQFEADARTQLAVSKADLLIENGGGYDTFMDTLVASTHSKAPRINVVDLSGLDHGNSADFNEHVFYDYPVVERVVTQIEQHLTTLDKADASSFAANAAGLTKRLQHLASETAALKQAHDGDHAMFTEPVPGYLFDAIGLDNVTPPKFSEAIEEGNDVPPAALNETLKLLRKGTDVRVLAYNEQASSPETELVKQAARTAGVPVVGVTETLPVGDDYVTWQQSNIDHLKAALR